MDLDDRTCLDCHWCRICRITLGIGKSETQKYRVRCDKSCWIGFTGQQRELYLTEAEEEPKEHNKQRWWWYIKPRKEFNLAQTCMFYEYDE